VAGDNPQPVILDTHLRTPPDASLVNRQDLSTWIVNGNHGSDDRNHPLHQKGASLISCPCSDDGLIDLGALMTELAGRRIDSLMVEGGARVITSFVRRKLADLFVVTVAPKLVGGLPVINTGSFKSDEFLQLGDAHLQMLGKDFLFWARPHWNES
jgi:riboflavin biosynthesis pyrimidine reductase